MGDTIFAQATPPGLSAIAVVRLSGPDAIRALETLCGRAITPRSATLTDLRSACDSRWLDRALVLSFVAPASFTGENSAEIQCHGGRAVVASILRELAAMPGLRPAEAGEFTRRALLNGRLDLTQVEALSDLLSAETELQHRQAATGLSGRLAGRAQFWREHLLGCQAQVEATIDFSDEGIVSDFAKLSAEIASVREDMAAALAASSWTERIRDGFVVALIGPPNGGKSTLLNAIAGRDVALTSHIPGTTRDVIEVSMDLDGLSVTMLDTAGLRDTDDDLELHGVDRAHQRAISAHRRVFVLEPDCEPSHLGISVEPRDILISSKSDTGQTHPRAELAVSGLTGQNLDRLLRAIRDSLSDGITPNGLVQSARQKQAVAGAIGSLRDAEDLIVGDGEEALVAEALARAVSDLDALVGRTDVEAMLDQLFAKFCIGK